MRSEEDLIRTLRTAAGHAAPEPALAAAVAARRRARRRGQWLRMTLAAAAVVLVAGGTTAVLSHGGGQVRPAAETSRVWPEAVFTMPGEAADGREYRPLGAISPTEVLVSAVKPGEPDRLESFDTTTGRFRTIGPMFRPAERHYRFQDVKAGEKRIVWWGETTYTGTGSWANFWSVPRAGGEPESVATVNGELARVDGFDLTGGHIVFSVEQGGVYRIPLPQGKPEKIEGTDGLHLRSWPLAAGYTSDGNQNRVVNLETGQSTDISVPDGARGLGCGAEWCAGVLGDGPFRQRPDGSDRRPLPAALSPLASRGLLAGRFVLARLSSGQVYALYDTSSGKVVHLDGAEFDGDTPTIFSWRDGSEITVVNLLAVR
ncbi:hypothetical protein AB0J42_36040 [Nonomuraea sp. NPDC049649]|uniref:hypothetical protein n=1 Tax=Nonomuraea sp. NPDC049649 TaxID=3155776 RepID=UPI00342F807A